MAFVEYSNPTHQSKLSLTGYSFYSNCELARIRSQRFRDRQKRKREDGILKNDTSSNGNIRNDKEEADSDDNTATVPALTAMAQGNTTVTTEENKISSQRSCDKQKHQMEEKHQDSPKAKRARYNNCFLMFNLFVNDDDSHVAVVGSCSLWMITSNNVMSYKTSQCCLWFAVSWS